MKTKVYNVVFQESSSAELRKNVWTVANYNKKCLIKYYQWSITVTIQSITQLREHESLRPQTAKQLTVKQ